LRNAERKASAVEYQSAAEGVCSGELTQRSRIPSILNDYAPSAGNRTREPHVARKRADGQASAAERHLASACEATHSHRGVVKIEHAE
jgi:hypothetical protein